MRTEQRHGRLVGIIAGIMFVSVSGWWSVSWGHPDAVDPAMVTAQAAVKQAFPGIETRNWQATPVAGLLMFTMTDADRVYYVDQTGRYLLAQAALFDMKALRNLTQDFVLEHRRDLVSRIPLDHAILYEPSEPSARTSQHTIYVFDDPDCPYCREFHKEIPELVAGGVTVAVLLHPIERIHKGATQKSHNIWCAPVRTEALNAAIKGQAISDAAASCLAPVEENLALAKQFGGGATPYLVLPDGRTIAGGKPAHELMGMLGMAPTLAQQVKP